MDKTQDTLDIKQWAKEQDIKLRQDIDFYIKEGVDKKKAVNMVLEHSTIGQGYNAQIRYDYLGMKNYSEFLKECPFCGKEAIKIPSKQWLLGWFQGGKDNDPSLFPWHKLHMSVLKRFDRRKLYKIYLKLKEE